MLSAVILANIAPLPGFGLDAQMQIIFVSVALATLASGLRAAILAAIGSVQRTDYLSIVATIDSFFALLFGSAIMILGFDAAAVPFVLVFGAIGQLLVGAYLLKKSFPAGLGGLAKVKKSFGAFLETYRYGIYVSLSLIAIYLIKNLDIIVLKMFLPYEKVGIYGVAESYSNIFFYITSVSSPLIPAIAEAYKRG
jgi:O-antigen/teichoic acid export membrane protein